MVVFQTSTQEGGNAKKEEQILAWCGIVVKFYSTVYVSLGPSVWFLVSLLQQSYLYIFEN